MWAPSENYAPNRNRERRCSIATISAAQKTPPLKRNRSSGPILAALGQN